MTKLEEIEEAMHTIKIGIEKFLIIQKLSAEAFLEPDITLDFITSRILIKLSAQRIGEKTYKHPNGLIQYFKQKFFPNWLLKKYPVKMKVINFNFRAVFPDYQPPEAGMNYYGDVSFMTSFED